MRLFVALISLAGSAVRLPAQAIRNVIVHYEQDRVQTSSTVTATASGTPFFFAAGVEGNGTATDLSPITGATVTLPNATQYSLLSPSLVGSGKWKYNSSGYVDLTALQAAFANGTYTMNLTGGIGYGSTTMSLSNASSSFINNPLVGLNSSGGHGAVAIILLPWGRISP